MDAAQWPQDIGLVRPIMDHQIIASNSNAYNEKRATRPQEQLNCPRCNSTNTKFCYYNNYSLTQPRYFCKGCRRYWTEGGSLRNVPVGGGSRKNKRPSSYNPPDPNPNPNPYTKAQPAQDLNLSFQDHFIQLPKMEKHQNDPSSTSALDLLRTGIASRFVPDSNTTLYSPPSNSSVGFSLQEFRPSMTFPAVMDGARYDNAAGRLFFPFGDFTKPVVTVTGADQDKGQSGNDHRYWNGNTGGGGSW